MEVLCLLNLIAERVATGSAPQFIDEIARFITAAPVTSAAASAFAASLKGNNSNNNNNTAPTSASTTTTSAAAADYSEKRLGVFSQLFTVNQTHSRQQQQQQQKPGDGGGGLKFSFASSSPQQAPPPAPQPKSNKNEASAATTAAATVAGYAHAQNIPLAIVVAGAGQDWSGAAGISSSGAGGGGAASGNSGGNSNSNSSNSAGAVTATGNNSGGNSLVDAIINASNGTRGDPSRRSLCRVVAVPNDAERVADVFAESATAVHRLRTSRRGALAAVATAASGSLTNNNVLLRSRVVCVFQMGEACQAASEDLHGLTAALAELVACRERYSLMNLDCSAVVVVRSPWYASVLLGTLAAPPLIGAVAPRLFESDGAAEHTFPVLLYQALRHFPFCVVTEATFKQLCVAWNCAHRMQDLVHAIHRAITMHLQQHPDLDSPGNRANRTAVAELLAFSADCAASAPTINGNMQQATLLAANSFTTLYYEVLVRRNMQVLQRQAQNERQQQIAELKKHSRDGADPSQNVVDDGDNNMIDITPGPRQRLFDLLFGLVPSLVSAVPLDNVEAGGRRRDRELFAGGDQNENGDEFDDPFGELEQEQQLQPKKKGGGKAGAKKNAGKAGNNNNKSSHAADGTPLKQQQGQRPVTVDAVNALPSDTMVFPAISLNAVRSFLQSPLRFDDAQSSDVVRLVCVMARHFRTGTTVGHLMEALGDRRRALIAVHEAAAAGIVSVRLDSGTVRLVG